VERKAWCAVYAAVVLSLGGLSVATRVAAYESAGTEEMLAVGKLGAAPVPGAAVLAEDVERRLAARSMKLGSPLLIRIFKSESELEVWIDVGGRFELFTTYPVCNWSGTLGPKLAEGDKQSPEGLYMIGPRQLRQSARWRRSLDLGFPNTFDRVSKRTGSDLLLHGGCTSTGCYAMTDQVIEEIFFLSEAALDDGQKHIQVHAFPFRMTAENLAAHAGTEWHGFWANLKEAHDFFERTRKAPTVSVCSKRYVVGEAVSDDDNCSANISATEAWALHRAARRARARKAMQAYAAARRARLAARAEQRQALHAAGQRKLPK
jgi:murein L,D-transpeptidase YafK